MKISLLDYVKVSFISETVIFDDGEVSLSFNWPAEAASFLRSWELNLDRVQSFEEILLFKITSRLCSQGWVEIALDCLGLKLLQCSDLNFLLAPPPASTSVALNSSLLLRPVETSIEIVDGANQRLFKMPNSSLGELLKPEHSAILLKMGILSSVQTSKPLVDAVSHGLHFLHSKRTTNAVNMQHELKRLKPQVSFPLDRDLKFSEVLEKRKSATGLLAGCPNDKDLEEFMRHVCGPRSLQERFHYPSAGSLYKIKFLLSTSTKIFSYSIETGVLAHVGMAPRGEVDIVRIYLVVDQASIKDKYKIFWYRFNLLDAGVILHQLSLTTALFSWSGRPVGWSDEVSVKQEMNEVLSESDLILGEYHLALS